MVAIALVVTSLLLIGLAVLQILVIAGLPYGRFTQGGQRDVLTRTGRIAAAGSLVLYAVFALVLFIRSGVLVEVAAFPSVQSPEIHIGAWVVCAVFGLGVLPNLASKSASERNLMVPISLVLTSCAAIIALAPA